MSGVKGKMTRHAENLRSQRGSPFLTYPDTSSQKAIRLFPCP